MLSVVSATAHAEFCIGPRVGYMAPSQLHTGVQLELFYLDEDIKLRPDFDVGFGEDNPTFVLTSQFVFLLREIYDISWPYIGIGPGILFTREGGKLIAPIGLSLSFGFEHNTRGGKDSFYFEARMGTNELPNFRFTAGYMFSSK